MGPVFFLKGLAKVGFLEGLAKPVALWSPGPWSHGPWSRGLGPLVPRSFGLLVLWSRGPLVTETSKPNPEASRPSALESHGARKRQPACPASTCYASTKRSQGAGLGVTGLGWHGHTSRVLYRNPMVQVAPDDIIVSLLLLVLSRCYTGSFRCDI